MKDVMAIIFTYEKNNNLCDLTYKRSLASIPFGGRYRIIDFILSSLVNTGIFKIGVITQNNYHSLMDHLGSGKEWDLNRKRDGLHILPPLVTGQKMEGNHYRGKIEALAAVLTFIRRSSSKYVILCDSDTILNLSFDKLLDFHIKKGADITAMYCRDGFDPENSFIRTENSGRITDIRIRPESTFSDQRLMEIYVVNRPLLEELIAEGMEGREYAFKAGVLAKKLSALAVYGYEYKGYQSKISSVPSYFQTNMDLLNENIREGLFSENGSIYTKVRDEAPSYYSGDSKAQNSLIADGCIIEGTVENSILSRSVKINRGAVVKNSIIMQGSEVSQGAYVEHAILDKDCVVRRERIVRGTKENPMVYKKGSII